MISFTSDSEHSNFSTFEVENILRKPLHPTAESSTRTKINKKRVHFDESSNQSYDNCIRVAEDCHETWYNSKDYKTMRAEVCKTVQRLRKQIKTQQPKSHSTGDVISALFHLASSIDYEVHDVGTILNDETKMLLSQLYVKQDKDEIMMDLIGLERHVGKDLRQTFKNNRELIQKVVYDIQKEYRAGLLTDEEYDVELRDSCLNFSQAFWLFAQLKATAQYLA